MSERQHPFALGDLIDYLLGELPIETERRLEEHLFDCPACGAELESITSIGTAIRDAVRSAAVAANVSGAFLERALGDGLTLREYRLEPGQSVACSAGPEDFFVVRLAADYSGAERLRLSVDFQDLESGDSQPIVTREVEPDRELGEVVLVFPGSVVRSYPRSLWSLTLEAEIAHERTTYGPFVMDHTP